MPSVGAVRAKRDQAIREKMKKAGVTYQMIADAYGWSWNHVWRVVNDGRVSGPVRRAILARCAAKGS
mgnify:FL=1